MSTQVTSRNAAEPSPVANEHEPCWAYLLRKRASELAGHDMLVADIQERDRSGREKYGVPLQPFNGRNPVVDLYQELLDAVVYCTQCLQEAEMSVVGGDLPARAVHRERIFLYRNLLTTLLTSCKMMCKEAYRSQQDFDPAHDGD